MPDEEELTIEEQIMEAMNAKDGDVVEETTIEVETPTVEATEEATEEAEPTKADEEVPQGLVAHEHWDDDRRAAFDGLSDEASKQVYIDTFKSLEKGYQTKFDDISDVNKNYEQIVGLMEPLKAQLNAQGLDHVGGIRQLVAAEHALRINPAQGLSQLVQQFGGHDAKAIVAQLAQAYGITEAADSEAYVDPEIQALKNENQEIRNHLQQNQNQAQATTQAEINNQVKLFMEATNDKGDLLHPHFSKVEQSMTAMYSAGIETDMVKLYDRAVFADPALRVGLIAEQTKSAVNTANQKVANTENKRASMNIVSNNVAPDTGLTEPDSAYDSVRKAMGEASAV